jgi:uncharacterized membrane protein
MSDQKIKNAISAVMALGMACAANAAIADAKAAVTTMEMGTLPGMEKCYGIAKKGMNDCGTASHNCAGEAKQDSDKNEWLHVPTGLCQKIVGGSTTKT